MFSGWHAFVSGGLSGITASLPANFDFPDDSVPSILSALGITRVNPPSPDSMRCAYRPLSVTTMGAVSTSISREMLGSILGFAKSLVYTYGARAAGLGDDRRVGFFVFGG